MRQRPAAKIRIISCKVRPAPPLPSRAHGGDEQRGERREKRREEKRREEKRREEKRERERRAVGPTRLTGHTGGTGMRMMPRRKDSTSRSEGVITEGEINVIFSNIVEILNLNQILLQVRTPPWSRHFPSPLLFSLSLSFSPSL
jgi:hypothetical protein